jgi:hypothetical protein
MAFFLQRTSDNKYVARPGSQSSYTRKLELARQYASRKAAEADRCLGNERIVEFPNSD